MIKISLFEQKTLTEYVPKDQKYIIDYLHEPFIPLIPLLIMAKKIVCDVCGKDHAEDQTYEIKAKSRSTNAVLVIDMCHSCFINKDGSFDKVPKKWKKWNTDQRTYVDVPV